MTITIRIARPDDMECLAAFAAALNAGEGNPTDLFTAQWALELCFGPQARLAALIAEVDGVPAGAAMFHDAINTGFAQSGVYLNDLYVDPAYRRLGVGRKLMAGVAGIARRCGRTFVWWTAKPDNAEGLAFYARLGAGAETVVAHSLGYATFNALADEDVTQGFPPQAPPAS